MCTQINKKCSCGKKEAAFHLRDDVMTREVLLELHCPACSRGIEFNDRAMLEDNGWIITFDMDLAKGLGTRKLKIDPQEITPEFLFDSGYATWLEIYPGEQAEAREEKEALVKLSKEDPKEYLVRIRDWAIERMSRLKDEGWRKAQSA